MILTPKNQEKRISYRCPACGQMITGLLGSFTRSADMLKLKCPCGESELTARRSSDGEKVRLEVPCLFCASGHSYTVSASLFSGKQLFLLTCPYSKMDIVFLGPKDEVEEATETADRELSRLIADFGVKELKDLQPEDMDPEEILPDARIYDIIRYVVKELEADGAIDCPCHGGEYEIAVSDRGITVYCPACHASHLFRTDSLAAAEEFLHCDSLTLSPAPDGI